MKKRYIFLIALVSFAFGFFITKIAYVAPEPMVQEGQEGTENACGEEVEPQQKTEQEEIQKEEKNPQEGQEVEQGPGSDEEGEDVYCTMDAKICPDGSAVGRTGPDCEFEACPGESGNFQFTIFNEFRMI